MSIKDKILQKEKIQVEIERLELHNDYARGNFFSWKRLLTWSLWLVIASLVFYYVFTTVLDLDLDVLTKSWTNTAVWAIILILIAVLIRTFIFSTMQYLIFSFFDEKVKFGKLFLIFLISGMLGVVTPFSSGGEGIKLFLLRKQKLNMEKIIPAVVIQNFLVQIVSVFLTISVFFIIFISPFFRNLLYSLSDIHAFSFIHTNSTATLIIILLSIGLFLNLSWALFTIFFGTSKRFLLFFVRMFTKLGYWFRFIKTKNHRYQIIEEWKLKVVVSKKNFILLFKSPRLVLILLLLAFTWHFTQALLIWISFMGLTHGTNLYVPFYQMQIISVLIDSANYFSPVPSSAGTYDLTFSILIQGLFNAHNINVDHDSVGELYSNIMLIWVRISLMIMPIIFGLIGVIIYATINKVHKIKVKNLIKRLKEEKSILSKEIRSLDKI